MGVFFHAVLAGTGTALPGGGTWQDRAERWHRLDFVGGLKRRAHGVSCVEVEVDQEDTLAVQEREDHRLVNVSLQWSLKRPAANFPSCASGAGFADLAKLRLPAVREAIEQKWRATPPMPALRSAEMMEKAFVRRGRQAFAEACPKPDPASKNVWISEETGSALRVHGRLRSIRFRDVRRRRALLLKCILVRWRASRVWEAGTWRASCDRLCRADDALRHNIHLQTFALRETSKQAACLVKRDRVAWMSEQTKHIAGQLVLGRTTLPWQLVRRISGKKRRDGRPQGRGWQVI